MTRFRGPDRPYAFLYDGDAMLCAPALFAEQADREFAGDRVVPATAQDATTPAARAAALLPDGVTVAVPAVVASEHVAGFEAAGLRVETVATDALDAARRRKRSPETERHRVVQAAAQAGMRRAEAVLAAATPEGGTLRWDGERLTTERLRRAVNATLAGQGVTDAANTVVGAGPSCADLHFVGTEPVRPGETVLLDSSPRGPAGYYGDFTRTFVVGDPGAWEREVYAAVDDALAAALDVLDGGAGTEGAAVRRAVDDALADHGFGTGRAGPRMTHGPGHGVGLALHEAPGYDGPLRAGDVATIEPGLYDPDRGGVRLEEVVMVRSDGCERLGAYPRSIEPRP